MAIYDYDKKPTNTTPPTIAIKEIPIYGSARLGQYRPSYSTIDVEGEPTRIKDKSTALGQRVYEFSNHLSNVLIVLADYKVPVQVNTEVTFKAIVVSANDYYPFGMVMEGRKYYNPNYDYRYGFNGKEDDKDFGENQLIQDYGFRLYNPAIGKFLSVDPLTDSYPWYTPYQFAGNKSIRFIDLDGLEEFDNYPDFWLNRNTRVDMTQAPDVFVTSGGRRVKTRIKDGRKWNHAWYWSEVQKSSPQMFSRSNRWRIAFGFAPRVDKVYLEHNPQLNDFPNIKKGMRLHHHHYEHGNVAYALPEELHIGKGYTKMWHSFLRKSGKALIFFGFVSLMYDSYANNDISKAVEGLDPLGVSMIVNQLHSQVEEVMFEVAMKDDYEKSVNYFNGNSDYAMYYMTQDEMLDYISGNFSPDLKSERFVEGNFYRNADELNGRYEDIITHTLIYHYDSNEKKYKLLGYKPIERQDPNFNEE